MLCELVKNCTNDKTPHVPFIYLPVVEFSCLSSSFCNIILMNDWTNIFDFASAELNWSSTVKIRFEK
jgi:hypothetical protein